MNMPPSLARASTTDLVDKRGGVRSGATYDLAGDVMSNVALEDINSIHKTYQSRLKQFKVRAPKYKNESYGDLLMDFYNVADRIGRAIAAIKMLEYTSSNRARYSIGSVGRIVKNLDRMFRLYKKILQQAGPDFFIDAGIDGIGLIRLARGAEKAGKEIIEPTGR